MYFITYSISVIIKLYMYMTTDNLLQSWLVTAHRSKDFYKGEWLVHLAPVTVLLQTVYPLTCISWKKTENWTTPNCYCILPCMHNVHYVCVCPCISVRCIQLQLNFSQKPEKYKIIDFWEIIPFVCLSQRSWNILLAGSL